MLPGEPWRSYSALWRCGFAVKLTLDPVTVAEEDIDELRAIGFSDEDVWDIVEVTAMFNYTNRLMSGIGAMPNPEYHGMAR